MEITVSAAGVNYSSTGPGFYYRSIVGPITNSLKIANPTIGQLYQQGFSNYFWDAEGRSSIIITFRLSYNPLGGRQGNTIVISRTILCLYVPVNNGAYRA